VGSTSRSTSQFWDVLSIGTPCNTGCSATLGTATITVDVTGSLSGFTNNSNDGPAANVTFDLALTDLNTTFTFPGLNNIDYAQSIEPQFDYGSAEFSASFTTGNFGCGGFAGATCTATPIGGGWVLTMNMSIPTNVSFGLYGSLFTESAVGTNSSHLFPAATASGDADFSDTAVVTLSQIVDQNSNPIDLSTVSSESGASYLAASAAPEPQRSWRHWVRAGCCGG
jgi:hypothetical protein